MIFEEFLSYFTRPLKINPAISEELESVASTGLILEGLAEIARCRVEAKMVCDKNINKRNLKTLL